jgi:hypothetical protein
VTKWHKISSRTYKIANTLAGLLDIACVNEHQYHPWRNEMGALLKQETIKRPSKSASGKGPSLFEVEYLGLLFKELNDFLKSSQFATIQEVVVGVRGDGYQMVLPIQNSRQQRGA